MIRSRLAVTALVIAGLASSTLVAEARSHKNKHHSTSSMSSEPTTTGANTKPRASSRTNQGTTGQGDLGPGMTNKNLPPASGR